MAGEAISNHWILAKKIGKGSMGAGGAAISGAQSLSGVSGLALVTGAAAASATGIGLVVTGAAITLATCGLSARSAYKTGKHLDVLEQIAARRYAYQCTGLIDGKNQKEHRHIADDVLPYIILQKAEKQARKSIAVVPVAGSAMTGVYGAARFVYKGLKGTLGKTRTAMATDLTRHLLTHNCGLAQAIVAELYSFEEMTWLLEQPSDEVVKLLARKMASS
jgi:hypothetical protein